jgi:hypothetical protein
MLMKEAAKEMLNETKRDVDAEAKVEEDTEGDHSAEISMERDEKQQLDMFTSFPNQLELQAI